MSDVNDNSYRLLIVDDHSLLRQAMKTYIELTEPDYVVDEARNGEHAMQLAIKNNYDLIVTDINMPKMSGFELVEALKKKDIRAKILAVSMHFDEKHVKQMLEAEVDGYMTKNSNQSELVEAIKSVIDGETYYSREVMQTVSQLYKHKLSDDVLSSISSREKEILYLILKEYSNKEIAKELSLSIRTIETHKYNLMQKTDFKKYFGAL